MAETQTARPRHRGADPGAYTSLSAPRPYFNSHPYTGSNDQTMEGSSSLPHGLPQQDRLPARHERRNSERLSPEASFLPVKLEIKGRAHRELGRGGSGDFGGENVLPATASLASIAADFNIYQGAQGREWEVQYTSASSHGQQHFSNNTSPRVDARLTARSLATSSTTGHRLGMPYHSVQRTAPKGDKISATLASHASQPSPEKGTVPLTTNSNYTSAVIRSNQSGTPFQQSRSRTSSTSSSSTSNSATFAPPALSSCATSPSLDSSIQTLLRASSSSEESDAGNSHHRSWSHSSSSSPHRQGLGRSGHKSRLTSDVLSPTSLSCSPNRQRAGSDPYGSRNLDSVGTRTSTSVKGAVADDSDKKAPTARLHHHRRGYTTSSGFLSQLRESSLSLLVNMGIYTPPPPREEARVSLPITHPLPLMLPARGSNRHSRSSTATTSASLGGAAMEYSLDSSNNLRLSTSLSAGKNERVRADTGNSLDSSSTSSSSAGFQHRRQVSSLSNPSKSSKAKEGMGTSSTDAAHAAAAATEKARIALEVIVTRIMDAQGRGMEATTWEVRKFVEGGGVEALIRGIETLGHEPGLAFNLMYVLRVSMMDREARNQAVNNAKGHILLEHVPSVMEAHLNSAPIFRDGLSVMSILLEDPSTVKVAVQLMLTPRNLGMVRKVRQSATPGSREEKLCSDFLARAGIAIVNFT